MPVRKGSNLCAKMNVFRTVCYIGEEEIKIFSGVYQCSGKHYKSLLINLTNEAL